MSELANRAISAGTQSQEFTDFRKLTACSIALTEGSSGAEAAAIADKTAFQKAVQPACMINKRIRRTMKSICQRSGAFWTIGRKLTQVRIWSICLTKCM